MPKKSQTTDRTELEDLTKEELVELAEDRGLTVTRGDGEEGEPLKADYIDALAGGGTPGVAGAQSAKRTPVSGPESGRLDETIPGGRYRNAEGKEVNSEGELLDEK